MLLRRAFYLWLVPAAFVLPLWLLVGWFVFDASGWALVWVLILGIPAVFIGQLTTSLLVRARGTVRSSGAVSWWDVLVFGIWHALTIAAGFYPRGFFALLVVAATVALGAVFWVTLRQLFGEARPGAFVQRAANGTLYVPTADADDVRRSPASPSVIVIDESPQESRTPPTP